MERDFSGTNFVVGYTTDKEKKEKIYRFRYKVYIEELGKSFRDVDNKRKWLSDELDETAILFYVEVKGVIIASSRMNHGKSTKFSEIWKKLYQLEKFTSYSDETISLSSRIMVANEWRGSLALGTMLSEIYLYARNEGIKFDFCNCSPFLLEFYEHLGYRRYTEGFVDEDTGYHVPLVLMVEDATHLKRVRSPFQRISRHLEGNSNEATLWFEKQFLKQNEYVNRRLLSTKEFWHLLEEKISDVSTEKISLFKGLSEEEIQKFIGFSTIMKVKEKKVIIRPGDVGQEMFVVLSGAIEVKSSLEDDALSLAILGAGQIFGEMAFVSHSPRNAAVISITQSELLVLTQNFFNKAIKNTPEITAKVLFNLANILSSRLEVCTQNWVSASNYMD